MAKKPKGLAASEARLAYFMLVPAFLIVFAIILFPVLANFWISFKPVQLGDLRAPEPIVRAQVVARPESPGGILTVRYRMRNSSRDQALADVRITAGVPDGLVPVDLPEECAVTDGRLVCSFDAWEGGFAGTLEAGFRADAAFIEAGGGAGGLGDPRVSSVTSGVLTNFVFTLDNFRLVTSGRRFVPALATTFAYTLFGSAGSILLGLFAAQLLNRRFPGKGILRGLFLFPYVAPVIAVAFTWSFMLDPFSGTVNALAQELGLIDLPISFLSERTYGISLFGAEVRLPLALATVIAFDAWRYFPFSFLFILARLQAIPAHLYESAEVDGAGYVQRFRHITIPQLLPVLSTLFLLRFMWTFNKFDDVFLLTGGAAGTQTLPIQVYDYAFGRADIGAGAATAVLLFAFLALFLVFYFRAVREGDVT